MNKQITSLRKRLLLSLFFVLVMSVSVIASKELTVSAIQNVDLAGDDILQVEAQTAKGFNFPYYLFIPSGIEKDRQVYMLVETNNTGTTSDELEVHRAKALRLAESSHATRMARRLGVPLLVPVFPRPRTNWQAYTHALDIDTLEIEEGKLKRVDLQLTAMIKYTQELLRINGFKVNERVFMHGFSASAKFCNRYSFLHPEMVKAVAAGGVNGLPTLPVKEWNECELPFPIGTTGIERFIDKPFNEKAFRQVAHYIYMGSFDRNDTLPSRDAWREEEADIIKKALAEKMMPDRWELSRKIYRQQKLAAQLVTYNGIAHAITDEMQDDVTDFFKANAGEEFVRIEPYEYPFVEYREIRKAHVNGLYWCDDERLPERDRENPFERTFLIGIEEWHNGQSHRQLGEFRNNAGFRFVLKTEGQKDIEINEKNFSGTRSWGDGEFQAFYVKLNSTQFGQIVPGVSYGLEPVNESNEYFWTVNDGVRLTRAGRSGTYDFLNKTIVPRMSFDCNIQTVIKTLENVISEIGLPDEIDKIEFVLLVKPGELVRSPNIKFSATELTVVEILWIACNRSSLEYRIKGNTIYIDKKR
ncbi:MAG: hypothetical protein ISS76_20130 [Phycisphaerae bacterium]|nr:hypothetical protein [Phycisphaerae bacterium]